MHEKVPMEHILCGNGAADLIFRLVWAAKPRTALLPAPTFAEYAARWKRQAAPSGGIFCRKKKILR